MVHHSVVWQMCRQRRRDGTARRSRLALRRTGIWRARGGVVFEGSLGRSATRRLLLVEQLSAERAAIRAVAQVNGAVAGRLYRENGEVRPAQAVIPAFRARRAAPAVIAATALRVPTVLAPSGTAADAPVLRVGARGYSVNGQRRTRHSVVHVKRDIAVRGGSAVFVHDAQSPLLAQDTPAQGRFVAPHALAEIIALLSGPTTVLRFPSA